MQLSSWHAKGRSVEHAPNSVLHPWLQEELTTILAALPAPTPSLDAELTRAAWAVWQAGLTQPFTLPAELPPLRACSSGTISPATRRRSWFAGCAPMG
jgi:hypothetical protein